MLKILENNRKILDGYPAQPKQNMNQSNEPFD